MKNKPKKVQSRSYGLILPCEWDNHMQIVYKAKSLSKHYYWIKHDRDFYGDAAEDVDNPHEPGELKKPHIHLLMKFNSSRDLSTVQGYFMEFERLKENSFEVIRNIHGSERYLIHADNPEKFQYRIEEVETNDKLFRNVFLEKSSNSDLVKAMRSGLMQASTLTFDEYYAGFASFVEQMNSAYQIGMFTLNLIKEWRYHHMSSGGKRNSCLKDMDCPY